MTRRDPIAEPRPVRARRDCDSLPAISRRLGHEWSEETRRLADAAMRDASELNARIREAQDRRLSAAIVDQIRDLGPITERHVPALIARLRVMGVLL